MLLPDRVPTLCKTMDGSTRRGGRSSSPAWRDASRWGGARTDDADRIPGVARDRCAPNNRWGIHADYRFAAPDPMTMRPSSSAARRGTCTASTAASSSIQSS